MLKNYRNPSDVYIQSRHIRTVLALKSHITGIKKEPKRDGKKFWEYTINTTAKNQYSKWKKPKKS